CRGPCPRPPTTWMSWSPSAAWPTCAASPDPSATRRSPDSGTTRRLLLRPGDLARSIRSRRFDIRRRDECLMRRTPFSHHLLTVLLLLGMIAACGPTGVSAERHKLYRIPTSSWRPGDPALLALATETLTAGKYGQQLCVWLAAHQQDRHDGRRSPGGVRCDGIAFASVPR